MKIAVLLTCFNRCQKTEKCLLSLKKALFCYNEQASEKVIIEIFLTDDGCTDGTVEAARAVFPDSAVLHILQGDGNLFWAGGMRFCWNEALKRHSEWNYYLLLNDDTELMENVFKELFYAQEYSIQHFGKEGIVSGITCSKDDPQILTYGGDVWVNRFLATYKRLAPNGKPQLCDLTNANILLVPNEVVNKIGIFYSGYRHGQADNDYSYMARKSGYPVVLTAHFCGRCDKDHLNVSETAKKLTSMTLKERKAYFDNPIHSNKDYLRFIRRVSPMRVPFVWIGRKLNIYFPKLYYHINSKR